MPELRLRVCRLVDESATIRSVYLEPADGLRLPDFLPGQFITLLLELPGESAPLLRTYSLAARPRPDFWRLAIRRVGPPPDRPELPPGRASSWFHERVTVGTLLRALPPRGRFVCEARHPRPIVLLSGGVGQTPLLAMLQARLAAGNQAPVWFIHGARNGDEHAFGAELRALAGAHPSLRVHTCYSQPGKDDLEGRDYDSRARVNIILLNRILPDNGFDFYLCGPGPFLRDLQEGLLAWDVPADRIHYELFGPAPATATPDRAVTARQAAVSRQRHRIRFTRSGIEADWDPDCDNLLDFAQGLGLRPPYSCRAGICHVCMCPLEQGEVSAEDLVHPPDPGMLLICCSRPRSDLSIRL